VHLLFYLSPLSLNLCYWTLVCYDYFCLFFCGKWKSVKTLEPTAISCLIYVYFLFQGNKATRIKSSFQHIEGALNCHLLHLLSRFHLPPIFSLSLSLSSCCVFTYKYFIPHPLVLPFIFIFYFFTIIFFELNIYFLLKFFSCSRFSSRKVSNPT